MGLEFADFDAGTGTRVAAGAVYGTALLGAGPRSLRASLYLPKAARTPVPVLVWMHGGGFETGDPDTLQIRRLARQLTARGFALAAPQYRLGAQEADLSPEARGKLGALAAMPATQGAEALAGPRAIAAAEDVARFLDWLAARAEGLGLCPRPVLGGSGAGAATAFNAAFLLPWLGLSHPDPAGILSYSGGFAWPGLYEPGRMPVFALHNPDDKEVDIAAIRALSQMDPDLELIEAFEHEHGALRLYPKEPKAETFGRLRAMLARWAGATAAP